MTRPNQRTRRERSKRIEEVEAAEVAEAEEEVDSGVVEDAVEEEVSKFNRRIADQAARLSEDLQQTVIRDTTSSHKGKLKPYRRIIRLKIVGSYALKRTISTKLLDGAAVRARKIKDIKRFI